MLYSSILLAYDGSLDGRRALREGAEIARKFRAHVQLLAVVKQTAGAAIAQSYDPRSLPSDEAAQFETILNEGIDMLKDLGLEAAGNLVLGDPVDEIVKLANAIQADLVVVGHRERSALARWWRTPMSMSLLDKLPCSLLVGRKDFSPPDNR